MIRIRNIEQVAPRAFQKAQSERPWITRMAERTYKVVPRRAGKAKYVVTFSVRDGQRFAECRNLHTQELCPSQAHVGHEMICYHVARAYAQHIRNARRDRERHEQKAQPVVRQAVSAPAPSAQRSELKTHGSDESLLVKQGDMRFRKIERVRGIMI